MTYYNTNNYNKNGENKYTEIIALSINCLKQPICNKMFIFQDHISKEYHISFPFLEEKKHDMFNRAYYWIFTKHNYILIHSKFVF